MSTEISLIKEWLDDIISSDESGFSASGLFVVDVTLVGPKGHQKLKVFLDGDKGVTIDQCAEVSRKLAKRLDDEDLIKEAYQLEVSSAGIDQPLKLHRQYNKNIGRQVKVLTNDGQEVKGKLISVSDAEIKLEVVKKKTTEESTVLFQDIQHTKVLVTF